MPVTVDHQTDRFDAETTIAAAYEHHAYYAERYRMEGDLDDAEQHSTHALRLRDALAALVGHDDAMETCHIRLTRAHEAANA